MTGWRRRRLRCRQVGRTLQSYLDGRSPEDWAQRVAVHLEECRRCGLEAETYHRLQETLRGGAGADDPALGRLRVFAEQLASGEGPPTGDGTGEGSQPQFPVK